MRFPADEIHLVRLGEKTRLTIPFERRRCPYREAGYYVLEREVDVIERKPCLACEETGHTPRGKQCARCGGQGDRVYYSTRTERVEGEERLQVLTLAKCRPQDISDDQALEEGWESAEDWRDAFFATHGEHGFVWTLTFELQHQPQYLARQHGQVDPAQYVPNPQRAIEDADAPTADEYRGWAEGAEADLRRQRTIKRLEQRRQLIDDKLAQLRRKAA